MYNNEPLKWGDPLPSYPDAELFQKSFELKKEIVISAIEENPVYRSLS